MKNFKAWMISLAVMVVVMVICGCACAQAGELERGEFYPKLTVVFEIETIGGLQVVHCEDNSQNQWSFFDDENYYKVGDIVNLLMWNMGEREENDEIVEAYKEGHTNNLEMFLENIKRE